MAKVIEKVEKFVMIQIKTIVDSPKRVRNLSRSGELEELVENGHNKTNDCAGKKMRSCC